MIKYVKASLDNRAANKIRSFLYNNNITEDDIMDYFKKQHELNRKKYDAKNIIEFAESSINSSISSAEIQALINLIADSGLSHYVYVFDNTDMVQYYDNTSYDGRFSIHLTGDNKGIAIGFESDDWYQTAWVSPDKLKVDSSLIRYLDDDQYYQPFDDGRINTYLHLLGFCKWFVDHTDEVYDLISKDIARR